MLILGTAAIFFAIVGLVLSLTQRTDGLLESRLATLRGDGAGHSFVPVTQESLGNRVFGPLASSLGARLEIMVPASWIKGLKRQLILAGEPLTLNGFLGIMVICELASLGFGTVLLMAGGSSGAMTGAMAIGALGGGILLPKTWLSSKVKHRQKAILKSLPDAFDTVTICVESGLGLEAAMAKVAEKVEGPFGEELAIALKEISMGKQRRDALKELADRISLPDLNTFITAVIQAETMGTSIATVLRVQAEQMRTRRRQRAEQQAQQAPVKMIFPLVLCIFPTLFLVILGPAGLKIMEELGGGKVG